MPIRRIRTEPPWSTREPAQDELALRGRTATELWGFGQHPSTSLCLSLLVGLYAEETEASAGGPPEGRLRAPRPKRVVELNCGSGLLCVAAAKLGAESAWGLEEDPALRAIAGENAQGNHAIARFVPRDSPELRDAAGALRPFDLALANLTAEELQREAELLAVLTPRGHLLIAGFTEPERESLEQRFFSLGYRLLYRETREGFIASVLKARAGDALGSA